MSSVPPKYSFQWLVSVVVPKIPVLFLALPCVVLMRILRPFVLVRLIPIKDRIGHAAGELDTYVLERKMGMHQPQAINIFFPNRPNKVNKQMVKLWSRVLPVSNLAYWVFRINIKVPGGKAHLHKWRTFQSRDIFSLTYKTPPQVTFTPSEQEQGETLLRCMGIPKGTPFVCIQGRDGLYLSQHSPGRDWSYHHYRNFPVADFVLAAQELIARGYYIIRMGRVVEEKFPLVHPQVIDYANSSFRSDFADIYLISKCHFFVGEGGIEAVARLFRKPVVYINVIPVGFLFTWSDQFLSILKLLRNKKDGRLLSFKEMLNENIRYGVQTKMFEDQGLEVIKNSPEEIRDVVLEMEERLKGQWKTTEEQEELQSQFWGDFPFTNGVHGPHNYSRIGALFLEKYQYLQDLNESKNAFNSSINQV